MRSIGGVQDALYDEVVANGWYERRPDAIRNKWTQLALGALIIAVVVTGVLAAFTTFGLVGLALVILALGPGVRRRRRCRPGRPRGRRCWPDWVLCGRTC